MVFNIILLAIMILIPSIGYPSMEFDSSTHLLQGDDLTSKSQAIFAQYISFRLIKDESNISIIGYGRFWKDFEGGNIRSDDLLGRIYYLYIDYTPGKYKDITLRIGRQFVSFSASGTNILDGVSARLKNIGPFEIEMSGGRDVIFSLDSEYSRLGNYLAGINISTDRIPSSLLGVSYVRKYDQ